VTEVSVDKPDARLAAPVVAVTVFADRARVTRRGAIVLAAGEHRVVLDGLPLTLQPDSVRVSGSGGASILGVDVHLRHQARTSDAVVRGLEEQLREAHAQVAVLDDEDAVAAQRLEFLAELARRSTRSYAAALSAGQTDPARVAELCDALDGQQAEVRQQRRELHQRRQDAWDRAQAAERDLAARLGGRTRPLAAAGDAAVGYGGHAEISYGGRRGRRSRMT
jgi:hypothetical protein